MSRSTRSFNVDQAIRRDDAKVAQRLADTLTDVDMTGTSSGDIAPRNPFAGRENAAKGILTGLQPAPSGLLEAYASWRKKQAQADATVEKAKGEFDIEANAYRKSRRKLRKALSGGMSAPQACALAHRHYRAKGGRSGFAVWARRIAQGG